MKFYTGTHEPSWLKRTSFPLFISRRRLARLASVEGYGPALGEWALDSGGFTELNLHGRWATSPRQYAEEATIYSSEIGKMDWAAIQDWMCEPFVLAKTGKTIREHQEISVASYLELRSLAPCVRWAPVLQGWIPDDYLAHAEMYSSAGVDLKGAPAVGVGSVCRRQSTPDAEAIFLGLKPLGLPLHGFGLKLGFLKRALSLGLASYDSMAWSFHARKSKVRLPDCTHSTCSNCFRFAMQWRHEVLRVGHRPQQALMF